MSPKDSSGIHIEKVKGNVVISQGQKGGVTTHDHNTNSPLAPKKKPFYETILFWFGVIASILTVLAYFGYQPQLKKDSKPITTGAPQSTIKKTPSKDTSQHKKLKLKKRVMSNEGNKSNEKPISLGNVKGDVVISQNQKGGITAHTVNITSEKYQELDSKVKSEVIENLKKLMEDYSAHPRVLINIESGDNIRHSVALEFENILTPFDAVSYFKGNTFMGTMPDYPVTIVLNPINKKYADELLKAISPFITSDYHFDYRENFDADYIKFFINGKPTFDNNGRVSIN